MQSSETIPCQLRGQVDLYIFSHQIPLLADRGCRSRRQLQIVLTVVKVIDQNGGEIGKYHLLFDVKFCDRQVLPSRKYSFISIT